MGTKKQTALEWLIDQVNSDEYIHAFGKTYISIELISQAKAIEKKQKENYIRFGYMTGFNRGIDNNPNHLEEYIEYIKTLGL